MKTAMLALLVASLTGCGPTLFSGSHQFMRSGYEVYPPKADDDEIQVFQEPSELESYLQAAQLEGYSVIGMAFADVWAEYEFPVNLASGKQPNEWLIEKLSVQARLLGADAIFDVWIVVADGICGEEEDPCEHHYGQAKAIIFKNSG